MTSIFHFQFCSLPQIIKLKIDPSDSVKKNKELIIVPMLMTKNDIIEEIFKKITSFLDNQQSSSSTPNSQQNDQISESERRFLEDLRKKIQKQISSELREEESEQEEDDLSIKELEVLNKSFHPILQIDNNNSTIDVSLSEEEKKVSDFLTKHSISSNQVIFQIMFNIERGFERETPREENKVDDEGFQGPGTFEFKKHFEKTTHYCPTCKLNCGFDIIALEKKNEDACKNHEVIKMKLEIEKKIVEFEIQKKTEKELFEKQKKEEIKNLKKKFESEKGEYYSKFQELERKLNSEIENLKKELEDYKDKAEKAEKERKEKEKEEKEKKEKEEKERQSLIVGNLESEKFAILIQFVEQSIGKTQISNWKLIYRATRDGFGAKDFHSKCDSSQRTLIIIKTTNGSIFGGFTTHRWNENGYVRDDNALIFSFFCAAEPQRQPKRFSPTIHPENAIRCYPLYGPRFGGGDDIYIANDSNSNTHSFTNLNHSFDAGMIFGTDEARNYLCGSYTFTTSEIEVYTM